MIKSFLLMIVFAILTLVGCSVDYNQPIRQESQEAVSNRYFSELEKKFDARLGVFALDTGTKQTVSYRSDERFAYASTHKALAVGALLEQKSIEDLAQVIIYTRSDLVNYSPITEKRIRTGMTLKDLCDASLRYSDNTAANFILKELGGPSGLKQSLRKIGDNITNPERFEPELNEVKPGENHDTSTPRALATSLHAFTLGNVLSLEKRTLLIDWLKRNTTGNTLIRAGVPRGWEVADKTGSAIYGTRNDIAVIWPEEGDPIVLAVLSSCDKKNAAYNDKIIAEATEKIIEVLRMNRNS
jgi:beta-lactamase class A